MHGSLPTPFGAAFSRGPTPDPQGKGRSAGMTGADIAGQT